MSTIALDNRGGNHTLAEWVPPSDHAPCPRCGIWRKVRTGRATNLCRDCNTVEHHAARLQPEPIDGGTWTYRAGVWRWTATPEPLSDEDRRWCEKAARAWARTAWERANRAGGDARLQRHIERTVA